MSVPAYNRYKIEKTLESATVDSMLLLAYELVKLKDEKGANLFWNDNEEKMMREYIDTSMKFSKN